MSVEAISNATVGQYTLTVFNEAGTVTSNSVIIGYTEPLGYESTPVETLVYRYALPSDVASTSVEVVSSQHLILWDFAGYGSVIETVSTTTRYELEVPIGEATQLFLKLAPTANNQ